MIKYFLFFFIFPLNSFSQKTYADFIQQDVDIQWAAEYNQILNLTPKLSTYSIRELAFSKANKKGCIEGVSIENEQFQKHVFCLSDTLNSQETFTSSINPFKYFISQYGNDRSSFFTKQSRLSFKGNAFKSKFEIDEVKQLFYYKNSNLFVTNTVVSPLYLESVDDSSANFPIFNWRKYYSVCNNGDSVKKLTTVQKQKLIDFGNVFEFYNFKYDDVNDSMGFKVFTKSNPNISHNLFEDIFKKNITVVDAKNNIIPISKIFTVNNPAYEIKSFDKKGNVNGSKFIGNEVNVDSFYIFCINQHYYFDTLKNILISEVNYLDFYRKIVTNAGIDLGLGFFYRIYFMKPSQYKKSNRKGFLNDF